MLALQNMHMHMVICHIACLLTLQSRVLAAFMAQTYYDEPASQVLHPWRHPLRFRFLSCCSHEVKRCWGPALLLVCI